MIPQELFVADLMNLFFSFSRRSIPHKSFCALWHRQIEKNAVLMCAGLIAYALFHEGAEVLHYLRDVDSGFTETAITAALATMYATGAILLRREQKKIFEFGGKKHGK